MKYRRIKSKNIYHKYIYLLLLITYSIITTSCGTKKTLYNPKEVSYLSEQLKIPINNNDPNIPLYAEVSLWLNTPYKYGGNTQLGTDCSGFVYQVYLRVYGKKLSRSSDTQAKNNIKKISKNKLKAGDLVFFSTSTKSKKINHVGIFLKNRKFIHASTSKGVIISSLDEDYYRKTWKKGGRVK